MSIVRIANPIYDVAFKYLMEDKVIARGLLSKIIGEEIVELDLRPREMSSKSRNYNILILRLDFKAIILTKEGERKMILIELQKAKVYDDLIRFRRYLGENYRQTDSVTQSDGTEAEVTLPIITVYFLGFKLPNIETPLLHVNRVYTDLVTGRILPVTTKFVEKLTHDSYIISVPYLLKKERTELERVLEVFNQSYKISDDRMLEIHTDSDTDDLTQRIINRLRMAATDQELLTLMEIEDEVESALDRQARLVAEAQERATEAEEQATQAEEKANQAQEQANQAQEKANQAQEKVRELEEKTKQEREQAERKLRTAEEKAAEQARLIEQLKQQLKDRNGE